MPSLSNTHISFIFACSFFITLKEYLRVVYITNSSRLRFKYGFDSFGLASLPFILLAFILIFGWVYGSLLFIITTFIGNIICFPTTLIYSLIFNKNPEMALALFAVFFWIVNIFSITLIFT